MTQNEKPSYLQLANKYGSSGGFYEAGDIMTKEYIDEIATLQLIARDYSRLLMTGISECKSFNWDRMIEAHARWSKP